MSPQRKYRRKLAAETYHLFRPSDGSPLVGVDPSRPDSYITLRRVHYESRLTSGIEIPRGFRTDLASIPKCLRILPGFNPTDPKLRMGLVHDALYALQTIPREDADWLFRSGLKADGVPFVRRWLMWLAVRIFGGRPWGKHAAARRAAANTVHGDPD